MRTHMKTIRVRLSGTRINGAERSYKGNDPAYDPVKPVCLPCGTVSEVMLCGVAKTLSPGGDNY